MATLLNIYGNHRLEFNSGKQLIEDISKRLNIKINDGGYQDIGEKTSDIDNITFFTLYNHLEYNFEKWNKVMILTNYEYCSQFNILKHSISYDTNFKYSNWIQNNINDENISSWSGLNEFTIKMTKVFNGDTLIYFNDSRFQVQEDELHNSVDLNFAIKEMSSILLPTKIEDINHKNQYGWFIRHL